MVFWFAASHQCKSLHKPFPTTTFPSTHLFLSVVLVGFSLLLPGFWLSLLLPCNYWTLIFRQQGISGFLFIIFSICEFSFPCLSLIHLSIVLCSVWLLRKEKQGKERKVSFILFYSPIESTIPSSCIRYTVDFRLLILLCFPFGFKIVKYLKYQVYTLFYARFQFLIIWYAFLWWFHDETVRFRGLCLWDQTVCMRNLVWTRFIN